MWNNPGMETRVGLAGQSRIPRVVDHFPFTTGTAKYIVHLPDNPGDYLPMEGNPDVHLRRMLVEACRLHGPTVDAAFWDGYGGFVPPSSRAVVHHRRPDDHLTYLYHHHVKLGALQSSSHWPTYLWSPDGEVVIYSSLDIPVTVVMTRHEHDPIWRILDGRAVPFDPAIPEPELLKLLPEYGHL